MEKGPLNCKTIGFFILLLIILLNISFVSAQTDYVEGEVLVKFKASPDNEINILSSKGGDLDPDFKNSALGKKGVKKIKVPQGKNVTDYIDSICNNAEGQKGKLGDICNNPEIESVQPNYIYRALFTPDDAYYGDQWGLPVIDAPQAWDFVSGSSDVVIAVLDTGVRYTHQDLAGNIWTNPGEINNNGLDDDGNGFVDDYYGWDFAYNDNIPTDYYGHGTNIAGVAAAITNNGIGVAGTAGPSSPKIMVVKMLNDGGGGTSVEVIEGINYSMNNGADIISMSFGGPNHDPLLEQWTIDAWDQGIVLVGAAGNDGYGYIDYPARYAAVIAVGWIDQNENRYGDSNHGPQLELMAPGVSILTTAKNSDTSYGYNQGSSLATPFVSGVAALLKSYDPSLSKYDLRIRLQETAVDKGSAGWDEYYGFGIVNAYDALALSVVNRDTSANFMTIQEAIDDPGTLDGHTIELNKGSYDESIVITKSLTIQSALDGMSAVNGMGAGNTVIIDADNVVLDSLKILNSSDDIISQIASHTGTQILNSIVHESGIGDCVHLTNCADCIIKNITAYDCAGDGISLGGASYAQINKSEIYGASGENGAINIYDSGEITVNGNYIHDCTSSNGILIYNQLSGNNLITKNIIKNNVFGTKTGFEAHYSNGITIFGPNTGARTTVFTNNITNNNDDGLSISNSLESNIIHENDILNNGNLGINLINTAGSSIFHNNIQNNIATATDDGTNIWDDGYPSGGNYWSDWTSPDDFSGPVQDVSGSDGIIDNPYSISGGLNIDNYPLAERHFVCFMDFVDVPETFWAYSYIDFLFCNRIINGYPDGSFQPGNSITRGQFAKMIVNANDIPEYYPSTPTFSDVPSDHWAYGYVEGAVQAGIISGYPDGTFKPASQVTRAQISAMIARSKGWTYSGGLEDFTDVAPSHWAYDNIMSMKEKEIIGGYTDGTFLPANQATRGQNSKMIALTMQTP